MRAPPGQIFYGRLLLAFAGGLFCAAAAYFHWAQALDRMVYDFVNEASPMPVADDVVIVAIDERSLLALGRWPWPREKHVELLRQLQKAGTRAVAMDVLFAEHEGSYPQVDQLLAAEVSAQGNVVLPVFFGKDNRTGQLREMQPIMPVANASAGLGHIHIEVDNDGVARSVFLQEGVGAPRWPHFSLALARVLGLGLELEESELPGLVDEEVLARPDPAAIIRSHLNLIPFMGPAGTVAQISYVDVMSGQYRPEQLRDKVVFVGATAAGHVDNITTSLGQISGVEINANIFQALRSGQLSQGVSRSVSAMVFFALTVLALFFFTRLKPRRLLLAVLCSALVLPLLSYLILATWRLWVSPMPMVLTLFVAYPLWSWLRLDTAMAFVQQQLRALEEENRGLAHHHGWADVEHAASFLQALGHVERWQWLAPSAGPAVEHEGQWVHERSYSSRVFAYDNGRRLLRLNWRSGHEPLSAMLPKIFPEDRTQDMEPGTGSDFINVNLVHLDQAYREASRNHELIREVLEQFGSGAILADLSGEVMLINARAHELLGTPEDSRDLLAVLSRVELVEEPGMMELVATLVARGTRFAREGRSLATDRELFCQGGLVSLERPMLLFVVTDVTELKRSEKRRVAALNFLSHDLRAPLTSVLALIESARDASGGPDPGLLEEIELYIRRNLSYAENFIQLAQIEHRKPARLDLCDAHLLVDNAVAQLYHTARKRKIRLSISYADDEVWVYCSRDLVERALTNLIDNAVKHSNDGSDIAISMRSDGGYAIFEVSDAGGGIAPADMGRIFEYFEQGTSARGGVGLGLRFVSAVAKNHSGSISVVNNSVGGCCFTLRISLGEAPA